MSGTTPRRYSFREEKRRIQREHPPVEIVLDDDNTETPKGKTKPEPRVMVVPSAATWSDDIVMRSSREPVAVAQQLVGDAELYEEFVRQGGSASILFRIAGQEDQGASVGESPSSTDS